MFKEMEKNEIIEVNGGSVTGALGGLAIVGGAALFIVSAPVAGTAVIIGGGALLIAEGLGH